MGPGNEHDSQKFEQVVNGIRIKTCKGRPKSRPREVLANAAYDTEAIRTYLRKRGIKCNIPKNKRNQKKASIGRPTRFDKESYKKRGAVERFFGWFKLGFRRIAPLHERLDECFVGFTCLAAFVKIWRMI